MRTTLPHRDKANLKQNRDDFAGLENWDVAHRSGYRDVLNADKLSFKNRIAIFKQHCDNLLEVALQFIEGFGLRMRARACRDALLNPGTKPTWRKPTFATALGSLQRSISFEPPSGMTDPYQRAQRDPAI
ncbi:MAG: hypothetical protein IPL11_14625 [Candidatus Accumulibacter sp.]|nr:hypothetical protein [Accumulibacter sp.]